MKFRTGLPLITALLMLVLPNAVASFAHPSQKAIPSIHAVPAPEDRIDINSATLEQLMRAPGMTRTWATRIIRFRPYHAKNDLLDRGVVTSQVYDRIKDYIIAHRRKQ